MTDTTFTENETVYLKSGSPPLNVDKIADDGQIMVSWALDEGGRATCAMSAPMLTRDKPDEPVFRVRKGVLDEGTLVAPKITSEMRERIAQRANDEFAVFADHTINLIDKWGRDRNIIGGGTSKDQFLKLVSEVGELGDRGIAKRNIDEIKDGIGDIIVVLIMIAGIEGVSVAECLRAAYHEIKDRKGVLFNGVFVKDSDPQFSAVMAQINQTRSLLSDRDRTADPQTLHDYLAADPAHADMQRKFDPGDAKPGTLGYAERYHQHMTDPTPQADETGDQARARADYYRGHNDEGLPLD